MMAAFEAELGDVLDDKGVEGEVGGIKARR